MDLKETSCGLKWYPGNFPEGLWHQKAETKDNSSKLENIIHLATVLTKCDNKVTWYQVQ
jgi:hypothetical protein